MRMQLETELKEGAYEKLEDDKKKLKASFELALKKIRDENKS
jgi:hypothetical protein